MVGVLSLLLSPISILSSFCTEILFYLLDELWLYLIAPWILRFPAKIRDPLLWCCLLRYWSSYFPTRLGEKPPQKPCSHSGTSFRSRLSVIKRTLSRLFFKKITRGSIRKGFTVLTYPFVISFRFVSIVCSIVVSPFSYGGELPLEVDSLAFKIFLDLGVWFNPS